MAAGKMQEIFGAGALPDRSILHQNAGVEAVAAEVRKVSGASALRNAGGVCDADAEELDCRVGAVHGIMMPIALAAVRARHGGRRPALDGEGGMCL